MSSAPTYTHDTYLSPFTWRYGTQGMRELWSETHKRRLWRRIWVALAEAQSQAGLVTAEQVADLKAHQNDIDLARAFALESELHHDLMAEVHTYAEQCPVGGGIIHLGATSMDIEDNADVVRIKQAMGRILESLAVVLRGFADQIDRYADQPTMAFTHLQPAEPTTMGYRLAQYAQDLMLDWQALTGVHQTLRGKGLKGAVGTAASYAELLADTSMTPAQMERHVMAELDLEAVWVSTQTYPRKQDFWVLSALAGLGQTLYKFAFDLRLLQSPPLGEWAEPFGKRQIGSSAMPFKRNPIHAENVDSLGRLLATFPRVAWDNAAHSLLERTLDDSANRRSTLPEACLIADEMLRRVARLIGELRVDVAAADRLMATYGPFAATEKLLMQVVKQGGDRQVIHGVIRTHAMRAWEVIRAGGDNPLAQTLSDDPHITQFVSPSEALTCLETRNYFGDAPARASALAARIRTELAQHPPHDGKEIPC